MFAMAYAILKSHRKAFMKMGMDEILELLQKTLETDFGYEDDYVVETILKECLQVRCTLISRLICSYLPLILTTTGAKIRPTPHSRPTSSPGVASETVRSVRSVQRRGRAGGEATIL